jgi:hypothetical protein
MNDYNNSGTHVPSSILKQYHKMGFKLIPIADDGVTPNINGLLTPKERENSIRESKSGRVEPVNYIYKHPEFWTEDRITDEAYRFQNAATTYGRSHIRDENGKDLFLNELDIDDKEIFTRLSIIPVKNVERYFLNEIGKETYGVKTRKKWGRRYYWLSHKQERPVRSNDCKIDQRFEIKTDNSTGHGTLPPSRYRNDPTKYYQSIGSDKIAIRDGMYDGLLTVLADCLIDKKSKKSSSQSTDQKNTTSIRFNLTEEDLEEISNEVSNYYQEGFRHHIIYGLSALLFKRGISLDSSEYIVTNLCCNAEYPDPEKIDRLATLHNTYEKAFAGQPIEGYSSLLKTITAIAGEVRARETMKFLSSVLNKYGNPILNQLDENARKELSDHTFELMSYSPLTFVIAHSNKRQILHGKINVNDGDSHNHNNNYNRNNSSSTISQITYTQFVTYDSVIINAIPSKITKYEDPTNIETKYEIDFETALGNVVHIEPKSIKDILEELRLNGLIYKIRAAEEALPAILNAFQRDGKVLIKREVETPGFYFVNGKIVPNKIGDKSRPTREQIIECANVLSELSGKTKRIDIFGTFVTWSIVAPFSYVLKQLDEDGHEKWMPWIYAYGHTNTGKTTIGRVALAIWGKHKHKRIHDIGFSNADTIPRFGRAVSYNTFPVLINEVTLTDDRQKQLVEALKHAAQSQTARGRLATRTIAEYISALSPCILTGNSIPPEDPAFRRRFIYIYFSSGDQHTQEEITEFNNFLSENMSKLEKLGDFALNYILDHQDLILNDGGWKTIGTTILAELFKSGGLEVPGWVGKLVQDSDLQEMYAEHEQIVRGFFIKKINDTYSRFFSTLALDDKKMDKTLGVNKLEDRIWFCCNKQLIPFIGENKAGDKIYILQDIMSELRARKITCVTSLTDLAEMFQTKPEPTYINGRTARTISISKKQFLDFLSPTIPI